MENVLIRVVHLAVCFAFLFVVNCQKEEPVDLEQLNKETLYHAASFGYHRDDYVKENLELGADPNARDTDGTPAIVYASQQTEFDSVRINMVKALVEYGADVNAANRLGETALKHFCMRGDTLCLDYMLSKGADVTVVDSFGLTPLLILTMSASAHNAYYRENGSEEHLKFFHDTELALIASEDLVLRYIKAFLERGADPLRENNDGKSALEIATEYDLKLIRQAIEEHLEGEESR